MRTALIEIFIKIQQSSLKKMYLKESSVELRPFHFGLDVLTSFVMSQSLLAVEFGAPHGGMKLHYDDVTMSLMASQITSLTFVYSAVISVADQRNHQSSASLAFVRGIHRGPVNSPHKWPVTRKMFPLDDVIMGKQWVIGSRLQQPIAWFYINPMRIHHYHHWLFVHSLVSFAILH